MFDGEAFGAEIVAAVKAHVERMTAPLLDRVATLERQLAEREPSPAPEAVQLMIAEAVAAIPAPEAVLTDDLLATVGDRAREAAAEAGRTAAEDAIAALPTPKDGIDGKDADPELIREMVAAAVAELPPARDGLDGKDADPDAMDLMLAQAVARLPVPKDGASVTVDDVAPMIAEAVEKAVADIPAAKDGVGLAGAVIGRDGNLIVTLTDGQTRDLGPVVGRDGADAKGEPGRDALQLTSFDTELSEDGRVLTLSLENDEEKITHRLQLPTMIYRGVFKAGQTYLQGDTVTWGGSLWHCDAETIDKPGAPDAPWRLAAKRGSDGKDAGK